jgi:hypothetical protein
MHDPRLGKFFAVDPLFKKYPDLTTYQFASNSPIGMKELEGLEGDLKFMYMEASKVAPKLGITQAEMLNNLDHLLKYLMKPLL